MKSARVSQAAREGLLVLTVVWAAQGCASQSPVEEVFVEIPIGTPYSDVPRILAQRGVIGLPTLFGIYGRARRLDRSVKAGTYRLARGAGFAEVYDALSRGTVVTYPVTFPEGMTLAAMAPRIAKAAGTDSASVVNTLGDSELHTRWDVPGPGLEGYLFPDTYRFAEGVGIERIVAAMIARYRAYWTPDRRDALARSGMTEQEVVTLASIVQAEAGHNSEMPTIAGVFHNRLRIGMRLQADPTIHYALPHGHRPRLLYAAMDSVRDHPYNTYTHAGLPPGPVCAPGAVALDAAMRPIDTDYLYFVRGEDRMHVFSKTLDEHNAAVQRARHLDERG
ncbi:MAG: endolytic transglycosylase MltG [Gemmatimonadetes bacterium]|nr:endolytic transglycosylase MltG [Gemmatimonadota bacterium]